MTEKVLILGKSGSGKSRSLKTLDPEKTIIASVTDKSLPFKTAGTFLPFNGKTGSLAYTPDWGKLNALIDIVNENPKYEILVIDDFQYLMAFEYMDRAKESGFQKFTEMGQKVKQLIANKLSNLKHVKLVYILSHSEEHRDSMGELTAVNMKTIGKMVDQYLTPEGLFTTVLFTEAKENPATKKVEYKFITQTDGVTVAKSPEDLFPTLEIENDLGKVTDLIYAYRGF